jgi:Carbohydrate phosphorylase
LRGSGFVGSNAGHACTPLRVKLALCSAVLSWWLLVFLQGLRQYADNAEFQKQWQEVKLAAKSKAMAKIEALTGVKLNPHSMLDVQVGCTRPEVPTLAGARTECRRMRRPERKQRVCMVARCRLCPVWMAGPDVCPLASLGQAVDATCFVKGLGFRLWTRRVLCACFVCPRHPCRLLQVKRIHEYKRQFLNVLSIIHRYDQIKKMSPAQRKEVGHPPISIFQAAISPSWASRSGMGIGLRRSCMILRLGPRTHASAQA